MKTILYFVTIFFLILLAYGLYKTDKGFQKLYKPAIDKIEKEIRELYKK